jgi:hypothetical protein
MELTGEPLDKLQSRRASSDGVQIEAVSTVLNIQFKFVILPCQADPDSLFRTVLRPMLGGVR